ncbi:SUKH-4 family immunity protein [Streptomyces sp. NA04227]|uniref:SUKH-4 family immunity protein n=1 Tax=Streptomyces sp. NA04227 TaxID=2742136 RepID=UPI0034CD3AB0
MPRQRRRQASEPAAAPALPDAADDLIRLGRLATAHLVLDGPSGALFTWTPGDAHPRALHADISTLAFALWLRRLEATTAVA